MKSPAVLLVAAACAWGQAPSAQLSAPDFNQACAGAAQRMEATALAVPGLTAAATPLIAALRGACADLQQRPATGHATYTVLTNLRAFLDLSDAVPKPYPFPEAARNQLRELRDTAQALDAHFRAVLDQKDADLRSPDRDATERFAEDNRLLPAPKPNGRRVVFLGDSLLAQWRLHEYFPEEDFVNRSINGQLSGQLLTRMKADVVDLKPAAVVLWGGSFDLTRNVPIERILDNFALLADVAAANNIRVAIASVLPVNDDHKEANPTNERTIVRPPEQIRALNERLKALATQRRLTYIDLFSAVVDDRGLLQSEASDDGLHPNARGYRLMAPVLAQAIDQMWRSSPARPKPSLVK